MGITRINTNLSAITAQRNINRVGNNLQNSIERLSSGLRINRAADDAAGLVVANRLRSQVEGLNVAVSNAQDGINLISVAEGALEETTNRLNRIRELSIQAANTGVNDFKARLAIQDEISQGIDEITRIANTTTFAGNFLLNGDFSIRSELRAGQRDAGVRIDASTVASTLDNGTSFLNIRQISQSESQIVGGDEEGGNQTLSVGIINQTDIAVSTGVFTETQRIQSSGSVTPTGSTGADTLVGGFFNGVSIASASNAGVFIFSGVLSDGETAFNGSLSIGGGVNNSVLAVVSSIRTAIDTAEQALFGVSSANSVPTAFRTQVTLGTGANAGRIILYSEGNLINQASLDISLLRAGSLVTRATGVTRSGEIGEASGLGGLGQVGNSVTAVTGSTFSTGQFVISVDDVQAAQQRTLESNIVFRDANGAVLSRSASLDGSSSSRSLRLNGTFESGVFTGGVSLSNNDVIALRGTNADGTTFEANFTYLQSAGATDVDTATNLNDFQFSSISGLVAELNFRTRDYQGSVSVSDGQQSRFEDALFTFTTAGTLKLVDDVGRSDSLISFTLTFQSGSGAPSNFTVQDNARLVTDGFAESATFRIEGGDAVRAEAGDVITLFGEESTRAGVPQPQATFRVGSGLTSGSDILVNRAGVYAGRLNGGPEVTFGAGDQDVVFTGQAAGGETGRFVTIDFDSIVDVDPNSDAGTTVLISTVNSGLNFQIGASSNQNLNFAIGNLKAENLGFGLGSGRSVRDIDVTTLTGANTAMDIVDEALEQVNRTRSILGAATNRLQSTVANLSVASENLTASESRIRDADIAAETSRFTLNQVLLQAGTSVMAQANFQSQGFLALLG